MISIYRESNLQIDHLSSLGKPAVNPDDHLVRINWIDTLGSKEVADRASETFGVWF